MLTLKKYPMLSTSNKNINFQNILKPDNLWRNLSYFVVIAPFLNKDQDLNSFWFTCGLAKRLYNIKFNINMFGKWHVDTFLKYQTSLIKSI